MPTTPARRPGPRATVPEVAPEELRLFQRLQRLRVVTPFQAHWLVGHFHDVNPETKKRRTERNTRMRLQRLEEQGFLKQALTHPERGGYSGVYYWLGGKALRVLGCPEEKGLLRPPPVHVLRYLLLRNEVYARARSEEWHVLSPTLAPEELHPKLLERVNGHITRSLERLVKQHPGGGWGDDLRSWLRFQPTSLSFDWLLKQDPVSKAETLVLAIVDDPRRAIRAPKPSGKRKAPLKLPNTACERCGKTAWEISRDGSVDFRCTTSGCGATARRPEPAPAQAVGLPYRLAGVDLLLRDTTSRWNSATGELDYASPRLRQWRRLLEEKYKDKRLLASDTRFTDLWAEKTRTPASTSSAASSPPALRTA